MMTRRHYVMYTFQKISNILLKIMTDMKSLFKNNKLKFNIEKTNIVKMQVFIKVI